MIEPDEYLRMLARRQLFTALKFWKACPNRACRRHRRCSGDVGRCERIFWPVVPPEAKLWWRTAIEALGSGRSARQAEREADVALGRRRLLEAHRAAQPPR
jgi:hypothetical protein